MARSTVRASQFTSRKFGLPTRQPGDIVIMDNLGSHKGKVVRALIRSVGAKLFFLPKYSPDLNPGGQYPLAAPASKRTAAGG
jgi:hypothetical protein